MANAINSLNFNNNVYTFTLPYGSCSTAAGTAAKTVDVDNFSLETGARVAVKFTVTNTAANPTLNVESTGAKAIYYNGAAITAGYLKANKVYEFIYNGTQWDLIGDIDTNTTYTFNGAVSTIKDSNLTANRALISNDSGKVAVSAVTSTELGYLDGVTSAIQTQLDSKAASSHGTHVTTDTVKSALGTGSGNTKYLREDGTWQVPPDTNTTYGVVSTSADGLAPKRDGSTTKFLRADGTWAVPPDTNTHAVSSVNGQTGAVSLSASDVGAATYSHSHSNYLPLDGGTLSGDLGIQDGSLQLSAGIGTASFASVDGTNNATLVVGVSKNLDEKAMLTTMENGTLKQYRMYGEHNITKGTTDLTAGTSTLATGTIYLVYE